MSSKITLGYWGIRGRGQVTRLVCSYTGVQWEQKTYTSPQEWFGKDKQQLGILFPNLPYIVDGELKITQSDVLPRYVIKKSGRIELLGKDAKDMALVDNVIYVLLDLWAPISQLFFNKKWENEKAGVFYQLKSKFDKLQKFINSKQTVLGYLTLADFFISEFSYYVQKLFPQEYSKFKSLQNIRNTIENLQQVKDYYSKPDAVQAVFLPPNMTVIPFYLEKFQPKLPPPVPTLTQSGLKKSQKPKQKQPMIINNGQKLKVILISGSLRKASTNAGLLRACIELNNPHLQFQWADISDLPIFSQDIEAKGTPELVQRIRNQVAKAHGILLSVAQNNSSPSAALKNAYDWLSRGQQNSVIRRIPVGMISVGGDMGGLRAQKAMKSIGEYCQVKFMDSPVIAVKRYEGNYFDDEGNLTDEKIRQSLRTYLSSLALWIDKNKKH